MYNLLELYSTMPTTKTVQRQSLTPVSNMQVRKSLCIMNEQVNLTMTGKKLAKTHNTLAG